MLVAVRTVSHIETRYHLYATWSWDTGYLLTVMMVVRMHDVPIQNVSVLLSCLGT